MVTVSIRGVKLTSRPFSDLEIIPIMALGDAIADGRNLNEALKAAYISLRRIFGSGIDQFWNLELPEHPGTLLHAQELVGLAAALGQALQADPTYEPRTEAAPEPTTPATFGDLAKQHAESAKTRRIAQLQAELAALEYA